MFTFQNVSLVERKNCVHVKVSVLSLLSRRTYTFKCELTRDDQMRTIDDRSLSAPVISGECKTGKPVTS